MQPLLRVLGFLLTLAVWQWVKGGLWDRTVSFTIILGGPLLVVPLTLLGRYLLDARPTVERTVWVATLVHYSVMIPLGAAIIEAIKMGRAWPGWLIAVPAEVGVTLMVVTGAAVLLTVVNLAVRGLGAPFAIFLSRRLARDWMYAWTRNPMVLSCLAFLVALGLWLGSVLFILWVALVVSPVWLILVRVYEERELAIRFGQPYRDYKARTPMLWPRKPKT